MHSTVTTLGVTGMTCAHCVSHVTTEVQAVPGVENVSITLAPDGVSEVTVFSDSPLDETALREAIDEAGYDVATYDVQENAQAAAFTEQSTSMHAAHNCGCGGNCGGGGGAGPSYQRESGTFQILSPRS